MLELGISQFLEEYFGRFHYLAPFAILLLCGIGFPIPEEVTLLGAGFLLFQGKGSFPAMVGVCAAAILIGDSIPFWLGRHYGMRALEIRWVRRILHPERFAKLQTRFREHGNWATFAFRFFAGVRIPGYFIAGTMKMSYPRFLLLDTLGVAISVPVSIYLGKFFGEQTEQMHRVNKNLHLVLAFLVIALTLVLVVRSRGRKAPPRP
jgi:membrane protein DedA with SNARE-associated domain